MKLKILFISLLLNIQGFSQSELIFHSGFEPGSTDTTDGVVSDIYGIDNSVSPPNDWIFDLETHPNIGNFIIQYQGGDDTMRFAKIIQDPTDLTNNVLHYWLKYPNVGGTKGRVQANLYGNTNLTEISQRVKLYLPSDWNILKNAFGGTVEWMVLNTFWNNAGWTGESNPYKLSFGIHKKDPFSDKLTFNLTGDAFSGGFWQQLWEESDTTFSVPVDQWMTIETYFKEGDDSNGRFIMAVTPENGVKQVIFDLTTYTHHPSETSPDGMTHYNPMKLYTSASVIDYVRTNGGVLQLYWDDYEIWNDTNIVTNPALDVSDYKLDDDFRLFPNPTTEDAVLEFKNPNNDNYTFTLFNLQGQKVRTITGIKSEQVLIKKENLIVGLYFFRLSQKGNTILSGKLILE